MLQNDLYEKLRNWRNERAFQEGKEPFMVFNNAALKNTAETKPKTQLDLRDIKGWGEKKIKQYGDEVLEIINNPDTEVKQAPKNNVLSVEQCISLINQHLSQLTVLKVQGEINDISERERYAFFHLKDKSGDYTLPCFIGWQNYARAKHILEEGQEVVIFGSPNIYKTGRFSLDIKRIEPFGEGALKKALEKLIKDLEKKGYFDVSRKRELPKDINKIGLITSQSGAAIKDFRKNLGDFGFKISFEHVYVEGDHAISSITEALDYLNTDHPKLDVIVLIRGGGSLENLKAFNSREIADSIITSRLPVITGVGHEKDISIADMCADMYFSTPTAVALYLTQTKEALQQEYKDLQAELIYGMERVFDKQKNILSQLSSRLNTSISFLLNSIQRTEQKLLQALHNYKNFIQEKLYFINTVLNSNTNNIESLISDNKNKLSLFESTITSLNPKKLLKKGYSIVYNKNGKIVKDVEGVKQGDVLNVNLYKGDVDTKIVKINNHVISTEEEG